MADIADKRLYLSIIEIKKDGYERLQKEHW
jgi:hypothetical protein